MNIYLHRANTTEGWTIAATHGWGVEVDVRTHLAVPYISHDPIYTSDGLRKLSDMHFKGPVILDVKEQGIIPSVKHAMPSPKYRFVLTDLITPDIEVANALGLNVLGRFSKHEMQTATEFGFWLDYCWEPEDFDDVAGSDIWLVSPELHGKPLTEAYIDAAYDIGVHAVCTDFPERWQR